MNGDLVVCGGESVRVGRGEGIGLSFNDGLDCVELCFRGGDGYCGDDLKSVSVWLNGKSRCVVDGCEGGIKEVKCVKGD